MSLLLYYHRCCCCWCCCCWFCFCNCCFTCVSPSAGQCILLLGSIGSNNWNRQNLISFHLFCNQRWAYNMIWQFDCTGSSSHSLNKDRLCLKIVLGQTRFGFYGPSYHSPCDCLIVVRFILDIPVVLYYSPWSKWYLLGYVEYTHTGRVPYFTSFLTIPPMTGSAFWHLRLCVLKFEYLGH